MYRYSDYGDKSYFHLGPNVDYQTHMVFGGIKFNSLFGGP
jgi:hypothetical protein